MQMVYITSFEDWWGISKHKFPWLEMTLKIETSTK